MIRRAAAALFGAAALSAACAAPDPQEAFVDVRDDVARRIGMHIEWNTSRPDDASLPEDARGLLSRGIDPDSAVQIALLNNRSLQCDFERLGIAQAEVVQAGLLANPIAGGNAKIFGAGVEAEFDLVRSFLDILFMPARRRVAAAEFEAAKARVEGAVVDLAQDVRRAFVRFQGAEAVAVLRRDALEMAESAAELGRRLRAAGNVGALAPAAWSEEAELARLDAGAAEFEASSAREALTRLLGLWGDDVAWRTSAVLPDAPDREDDVSDVESRAVAASLDLEENRRRVDAAAQAAGLADWSAFAAGAEAGVAAKRETDGSWGVGPEVRLPIPVFDTGRARSAGAAAALRLRLHERIALAVAVRSAVRAAADRVQALGDRVRRIRGVLVPLNERIVKETQLQYNAMQVPAFDLFRAKRREIDARANYAAALRDYRVAREDLRQLALGRMPPNARTEWEPRDDGARDASGKDR